MPSIGPLLTYKEPVMHTPDTSDGVTVRIDTGVCEGATISMYYDPMIAKLCTHADTRDKAVHAMERALDEYFISGLINNTNFLRSVCRNKAFREGNYGTSFIPEQYPKGFHGELLSDRETLRLVASAASIHQARVEVSRQTNGMYGIEGVEEEPEEMFVVIKGRDPKHPGAGDKLFYTKLVVEDEAMAVNITPIIDGKKGKVS